MITGSNEIIPNEDKIQMLQAEFKFMKMYRIVLNYLIEEEISEASKKFIKVKLNFKIEFY